MNNLHVFNLGLVSNRQIRLCERFSGMFLLQTLTLLLFDVKYYIFLSIWHQRHYQRIHSIST